MKLPALTHFVLLGLLPLGCFFGLQLLSTTLSELGILQSPWSLLLPWLGTGVVFAGLCGYSYNAINQHYWKLLCKQKVSFEKQANDLQMAQARVAAAHHYVDRLKTRLHQAQLHARANSAALSQSVDERTQRQQVYQNMHQRFGILAQQNLHYLAGYMGQLSQDPQGTTQTPELKPMQSAHKAISFYIAELEALMTSMTAAGLSPPGMPQRTNSASVPAMMPARTTNYDLRACVHDAIALLQPYLATDSSWTQSEIWPVYTDACLAEYYGDAALVRRTLFYYLLTAIDTTVIPPQTSLILHVHYTEDPLYTEGSFNAKKLGAEDIPATPRLEFRLETGVAEDQPKHQDGGQSCQQQRLAQLLAGQGGQQPDIGLYISTQATTTPSWRGTSTLTASLHPRDPNQAMGLQSCLYELNIKVVQNAVNATTDFCIIGLTDAKSITNITDALAPNTTVILLNNIRVYQKPGWLTLSAPLNQRTLIDCTQAKSAEIRQQQLNILVVDDDKNARQFLCTLLGEYGATVFAAADGLAALATATIESIDLIFMDIHMPRMNGLEATRQLRASLDKPLPIIALTAHVIDSERAAITEAGMNAILIKPVDLVTLRQTLHQWVGTGGVDRRAAQDQSHVNMPVFDTLLALKIANQRPALAIEMLALFMQSLDTDQDRLRHTNIESDPQAFAQLIHRLNGAARFCGVPRIQAQLQALEVQIKAEPKPTKTVPIEAVQQLHIEFNRLRDWYQKTANPLATQAMVLEIDQPSKIT